MYTKIMNKYAKIVKEITETMGNSIENIDRDLLKMDQSSLSLIIIHVLNENHLLTGRQNINLINTNIMIMVSRRSNSTAEV